MEKACGYSRVEEMGAPAGSKTQWVSVSPSLTQTLPQTSPASLPEITRAKLHIRPGLLGRRKRKSVEPFKEKKRYTYVL